MERTQVYDHEDALREERQRWESFTVEERLAGIELSGKPSSPPRQTPFPTEWAEFIGLLCATASVLIVELTRWR